jgi:hypothetical protein
MAGAATIINMINTATARECNLAGLHVAWELARISQMCGTAGAHARSGCRRGRSMGRNIPKCSMRKVTCYKHHAASDVHVAYKQHSCMWAIPNTAHSPWQVHLDPTAPWETPPLPACCHNTVKHDEKSIAQYIARCAPCGGRPSPCGHTSHSSWPLRSSWNSVDTRA